MCYPFFYWQGEQYNELVDVYAYGMCLLELLTCRLPWYGAGVTAEVPEKVKVCSMPLAVWQK